MDGTEAELSLDDVMADQGPDDATSAVERFQRQGVSLVENAKSLTIVDDVTYTRAGEILTLVAGLRKEITAFFSPLKSKAAAAHKAICDAEKQKLAPVAEAESAVKRALVSYEVQQERKRRELEARLREEAKRAEEAAKREEAADLESRGEPELAQRVLAADSVAPPVIVPKLTPKLDNASIRELWKWELIDLAQVPREYLVLDEKKVGALVRALKSATQIPGIRVYAEKSIAAR